MNYRGSEVIRAGEQTFRADVKMESQWILSFPWIWQISWNLNMHLNCPLVEFAESRSRALNSSCYHFRSTTIPNSFTRVFLPISRETDS